jgi:hypothetical protein
MFEEQSILGHLTMPTYLVFFWLWVLLVEIDFLNQMGWKANRIGQDFGRPEKT